MAAWNDQPALSPQKVERAGAGFIRPQQGKPECQSDNQDEEHRMSEALPGCSGRVAMIPVQLLSPELQVVWEISPPGECNPAAWFLISNKQTCRMPNRHHARKKVRDPAQDFQCRIGNPQRRRRPFCAGFYHHVQ